MEVVNAYAYLGAGKRRVLEGRGLARIRMDVNDHRPTVTRIVEARTGRSIKKLVTTTRRFRTIQIRVGDNTITAADPLSDELAEALSDLRRAH